MPDLLTAYAADCAAEGRPPTEQGYQNWKAAHTPARTTHGLSPWPELQTGDGQPFTISNQRTQDDIRQERERKQQQAEAEQKAQRISTLRLRENTGGPEVRGGIK